MVKLLSLFNNKGGVGKTTLTLHLSAALAELGYKVLMIDVDPQCNLTLASVENEKISEIWKEEDEIFDLNMRPFIQLRGEEAYKNLYTKTRSSHFLVKCVEDGESDREELPPPLNIQENLYLVPGRLTLHLFEEVLSQRWTGLYKGDPLSIRTFINFREKALKYAEKENFDYIIFDTSPSLGTLNKTIISTVDGFITPCMPDLFSLYGIKNIGKATKSWSNELEIIKISSRQKQNILNNSVQFLGYTIYNAKPYKYKNKKYGNEWDLAVGHYNHAKEIPETIKNYISEDIKKSIPIKLINEPIGGISVMHSHNTRVQLAQKYHVPIWKLKELYEMGKIDSGDENTVRPAKNELYLLKEHYIKFAEDVVLRLNMI